MDVKRTILSNLLLVVATLHPQIKNAAGDQPQTWNTEDYYKREHSLSKPYQGAGWDIPNWHFFGNTIVSSHYVRLTTDVRSQMGALWNAVPVKMRNWEVQVEFKVHGSGTRLHGDGFAFWYAKDRMVPGPIFGSKDYFSGLGVILDTYSNHNGPHAHQHPYISSMVNNGSLHYDHDRDGTHTQLAGCEAKFRNLKHDTWFSVRYENDVLTVSTDIKDKRSWEVCFMVEGVKLPTGYYFGFSAATGDLSDNHDLITIKTYELDLPGDGNPYRDDIIPSAEKFEPPREHVPDPETKGYSGIKIFLYTFMGIILVFAVVFIGLILYQNHEQNRRKRFY